MKQFNVQITTSEVITYDFDFIDAETKEDAEKIAYEIYKRGECSSESLVFKGTYTSSIIEVPENERYKY